MPTASRCAWCLLLISVAAGCAQRAAVSKRALAGRVLPPPNVDLVSAPVAATGQPEVLAGSPPAKAPTVAPATRGAPLRQHVSNLPYQKLPERPPPAEAVPPGPVVPQNALSIGPDAATAAATGEHAVAGQPLTLDDAIALAFRMQPRLRASLESIRQARGREDIAFAAFLPTADTSYHVGGLHINAGGTGFPILGAPNSPRFVVLPLLGSVPVGLNGQTGYELAELKLQWLICDFGRRMGAYRQSMIAASIAQLQTQRAYQTVAYDVAAAYFQVLRTRSLRRIAIESVRRGQDDLDVAQKLAQGGVVEREKVLRAQVALAQALRGLDVAEEQEAVAVAALNLAIGLNVSAATGIVDTTDAPPFDAELAECLRVAIDGRREFQVARQSVQAAQEGTRAARADFAPRIVTRGSLFDYQQSSPRGHFDIALGYIGMEWGLYDGGRRVGELRVANSRVRESLAQADSIADTIAFQVTQAYRQLAAARKGIDRTRPAVEQSRETYRLVQARSREGDAIPAELTDAEAALTRAELDYLNSIYDYLIARTRLEYAMGTSPTPATIRAHARLK
ncbi:MAG TPA: TolC family protein [Pirellulales bacterium]